MSDPARRALLTGLWLLSLSLSLQYEAIPESLKNMLLIMSTQGIFDTFMNSSSQSEADSPKQQLWETTWGRIETFLPNFIQELFPSFTPPTSSKATPTTENSHSEEKESKDSQNDSLGAAVVSSPVAVPAVSGGNASPPPALDIGSPSRSPQQSSITGMCVC